jgi:hypothetical protein
MAGSAAEGTQKAKDAVERPAGQARRDAEQGRSWFAVLARAGLIAKGVSYGLVGLLAFKLALRDGGSATSREGALATLAREPFGEVGLVLLAFGFAGYAVWRLVEGILGSDEDGVKDWGKRAGYIGRALMYAALTFATVRLLFGTHGESQTAEARGQTATVLGWPGGKWIVAAAGVAIVGAGAWNAYRGITRKFEEEWRTGRMSRVARAWGGRVAVLGHVARGVVFTLIGVFLVKAALEYHAKEVVGLDGALRKVVHAPYGPYLLGLVATGLLCYGAYCIVDARYRDLSTRGGA